MRTLTAHAAGVDIGAHAIVACVPDGEDQQSVRTFGPDTAALQTLADWLGDRGRQTVAMAATGVYWMPLFEALAARGLQCCLLSAQSIQRVPGRTSDGLDCPWIQTLHSDGVLSASFRPDADGVARRTLLRHRAQLLEPRAPHLLHLQKALLQRHIPWSHALREVPGTTGLRISRAIVAGERDPQPLAALRHDRCKQAAEEMALARTGTWRAAHLFVLGQVRALFDCSTVQLRVCDTQIDGAFSVLRRRFASALPGPALPESSPPPRRQPHSHRKHAPAGNPRAHILRITGVDRVAVPGMRDALAQTIFAEIGTDMHKWPEDKPCCSWLGLAPQNDLSGGQGLQSRTMKNRHRAAHACRMAAPSVLRSHWAFGAFSRRLKGRLGPAQALVATAHQIARTVYHMLKHRVPYHEMGAAEYH
jgi:transposase